MFQTKSLIHVNVPRAFREEVLYNQDIWASSLGLRPAEPLLLVSGAQYDAEEVDVMALLAALKEDIGPMNTLHALGKCFTVRFAQCLGDRLLYNVLLRVRVSRRRLKSDNGIF